MKHLTFTSIATIICFAALITLASCSKSSSTESTTVSGTSADSITRKLSYLYITVAEMKAKITTPKRLVFNFTDSSNAFTLSGWFPIDTIPVSNYPLPPAVKLKIGKLSAVAIDQNTYLGNVIISRALIAKLKIYDGSKSNIIFAPEKDATGHVLYKVMLSKQDPTKIDSDFSDAETGGYANPSPPRPGNGGK